MTYFTYTSSLSIIYLSSSNFHVILCFMHLQYPSYQHFIACLTLPSFGGGDSAICLKSHHYSSTFICSPNYSVCFPDWHFGSYLMKNSHNFCCICSHAFNLYCIHADASVCGALLCLWWIILHHSFGRRCFLKGVIKLGRLGRNKIEINF